MSAPSASDGLPLARGNRNSFVLGAQSWAGGASDVGLKHFPNQDAIAIAADTDDDSRRVAVVAVSDGVSTSHGSEHASMLAAQTACLHIADTFTAGVIDNLDSVLVNAFTAANHAIAEQSDMALTGAWACTLIVAIAAGDEILVGNVGDSRAYFFPDDGESIRLSLDDSMAQARIALGVDPTTAETGPSAHAITKWLGVGSPDVQPTITRSTHQGPGWLCVCTDGLWNYASDPKMLRVVVNDSIREDEEAWRIAERLVNWANAQGGRDNIAVGLVRTL